MQQENELKASFIEEYSSAGILRKMGRKKSSVILISKSLFALCDYLIFKKYGKLPKNHSERFRILKMKENEIYSAVDSVWSKYRDTYSKPSEDKAFVMLDTAIKEIVKNEIFDKEIKKIVEE